MNLGCLASKQSPPPLWQGSVSSALTMLHQTKYQHTRRTSHVADGHRKSQLRTCHKLPLGKAEEKLLQEEFRLRGPRSCRPAEGTQAE